VGETELTAILGEIILFKKKTPKLKNNNKNKNILEMKVVKNNHL
jgi:hypothetical protein